MSLESWDEIQQLVEKIRESACCDEEQAGLEALYTRLFDLLRPQVRSMMRTLTRDQSLVDDLTQDVLVRLWKALPHYNPKIAPFKHWLGRVVINHAYNQLNRHNRIARHEVRESEWFEPDAEDATPTAFEQAAAPDSNPDEQLGERERLELILACAREALSDDEYLVWLEQVVNGSSYREIAELMDCSENRVRQTMFRARQKVAAAIVLHPRILSAEEIHAAIARCMHSEEPLTEYELTLLQQAVQHDGQRTPPGWRQQTIFRQACMKVLAHLLGCLILSLAIL